MTSNDSERQGMYRCGQTGVRLAQGLPDESHYVMEMPHGGVHELDVEKGELDIETVSELLELYGSQVY